MSKDKISDYSSTANSNTDIAGINIDEGCAPSGINDAIRTLMAQLKTWQSGGQDVYIHPAGTASAPSVTANGDTNTGIFFPAADTVAVTTGGSERARVDSSGNLGLGVTPSAWASGWKAIQLNSTSAFTATSSGCFLNNNNFFNGTSNLYITSDFATRYLQTSGEHRFYTAASGTAGNAITFTQAMTLDASGNLGLATTSPTARLTIGLQSYTAGATLGMIRFKNDQTTADGCIQSYSVSASTGTDVVTGSNFYVDTSGSFQRFNTSRESSFQIVSRDGAVYWGTGGTGSTATERARIDSSGNLLVGATSFPGAGTSTTGAAFGAGGSVSVQRAAATPCFFGRSNDGEVMALYSGTTQRGQVSISGATTTYGSFSDYRLKENIIPLTGAVAKVMALKPSTFNFIEFPEQTINGFIAHEVAAVEPIAVTGQKDAVDEEGKELYQSVDPAKLVPLLTAALQEQQAIINAQQAALTALTARIESLEQA